MDVKSELGHLRQKIEENLDSNKAYALLLMEMDIKKHEVDDKDKYVSLTEIAKLKNFENPSYIIQSWHRDIAIDFYTWIFLKKRYELIKMIAGKAAFIETIRDVTFEEKLP